MKLLMQLFAAFFKIGLFTIGGGLAMLPLIQKAVVEEYQWMDEDEMIDCLAICQSIPGVVAINSATYIGYKKKGMLGAIAASCGVILPSFIIIILAVLFLGQVGDNRYVSGAFTSITAASCALILFAAYKLGKQILKDKFSWVVTVICFLMTVVGITALWAIIFGALAGLILFWHQKYRLKGGKNE
ncbi:chromate transporter [Clostridium aminobutyricum]|uniref:Chromate transporter n=1 Tax=Clostridium aminobutyricum TaxID=33953 RepID=A0A939DAB3_CLOAM|nr:chromate transporter [Clostridium aminobutyricum]MBN7774136.1 chromate transporter [Clostridium aminobutyricum]